MTPEVYVNKEIMPLLLKVNCPLERVIKQDFRPVYYTKDFNDEDWQDCEAYYIPTQAQVMKWLREVHHLHIITLPYAPIDRPPYHPGEADIVYIGQIFKDIIPIDEVGRSIIKLSTEEACEAAIKYCLTKLI